MITKKIGLSYKTTLNNNNKVAVQIITYNDFHN